MHSPGRRFRHRCTLVPAGFAALLLSLVLAAPPTHAQTTQPQWAVGVMFNDANGNGDNAGDRVIINPNANNLFGSDANLVCRNAATGATSIGPTITAATSTACGSRTNVVGYVATNPAAHFIRAGLGAITNSGRNIVNSPGFNLWNMSIFKNTSLI